MRTLLLMVLLLLPACTVVKGNCTVTKEVRMTYVCQAPGEARHIQIITPSH